MTEQELNQLKRKRSWVRFGLAIPISGLVILYLEAAEYNMLYGLGVIFALVAAALVLSAQNRTISSGRDVTMKRIFRQLYGIDFVMLAWLGFVFLFLVELNLQSITLIVVLFSGLFSLSVIQWVLEGKMRMLVNVQHVPRDMNDNN
ncbi:hypothetical protein EVJ20_12910 [Exiguobacterium sp. SH0S1]|uniref:hypothetical protein n=1 Tax=Exiguobacterium sp. SH0S1 TaxID=2510949 RepID=UPI0010389777|nr:hypothetical protein [Exiguobacterium sp. SH0S1]TCI75873.1 hypothetical protein EVJ20_12910 [Exiguobacterium sp. SH0S1]